MKTFSEKWAELRRRESMSQEQLAEKAGLERSRVSKTEIAWVGTSLDTIFKIADALEVEPYILLKDNSIHP